MGTEQKGPSLQFADIFEVEEEDLEKEEEMEKLLKFTYRW